MIDYLRLQLRFCVRSLAAQDSRAAIDALSRAFDACDHIEEMLKSRDDDPEVPRGDDDTQIYVAPLSRSDRGVFDLTADRQEQE